MTAQFTIIFINWLILHFAGLASMVVVFDTCFKRRHSLVYWVVYVGIRGLLRSYMSTAIATGSMTPGLYTFYVIFIAVTAIINFVMLWFTWEADLIQIGILGIATDLMTGAAMIISIGTANLLENGSFEPGMVSLNTGYTTGAAIALFLMVVLILNLLNPVVRWFRTAEFSHRRLLAAIIIISTAIFSSTNLTDTAGFDASSYYVCLIGILLFAPLGLYAFKMLDIQRSRRQILRQQAEIGSAYILAVGSQAESIASHRKLLDSVAAQIESSDFRLRNDMLRSYVQDLKRQANRLRGGMYSSNLALDAVLASFAAIFDDLGCKADLKADVGEEDEMRAAEITWIILNWAESAISVAQSESKAGHPECALKYRILRQANQLIFSLSINGAGTRVFPERLLRGHMRRSDVISQRRSSNSIELNVMTESSFDSKEGI